MNAVNSYFFLVRNDAELRDFVALYIATQKKDAISLKLNYPGTPFLAFDLTLTCSRRTIAAFRNTRHYLA
jgi:hypothetical protein